MLSHGDEFSKAFRTFTCIRQGATSSFLLFVLFVDDLIDYLKRYCQPERLLHAHCLLHADDDIKKDIVLKNGTLEYKKMLTYLGVIISDYGNITKDVNLYVTEKRSNVVIKYSNFCRKNLLAPLAIKLRVLDTCVSSSLIYGCEAWGNSNFVPTRA